jgi:hypothetical protein
VYGGTWGEYMDTPAAVTEMLLRIEDMHTPKPSAPLGTEEFTPSIS